MVEVVGEVEEVVKVLDMALTRYWTNRLDWTNRTNSRGKDK